VAAALFRANGVRAAVLYDTAGVHPQCSEGDAAYLQNCVLPSDYFFYLLSADPVMGATQTCAQLGFEFVEEDPVFDFKLFWKGGPSALGNWSKGFSAGHPKLGAYLNHSKNVNVACRKDHRPQAAVPATAGGAAMVTSYDASGVLPQCAEGPAAYMSDCVQVCDMVAYLKSSKPTLIAGSHCSNMGFTYQAMDSIYTKVQLYWKAGAKPSMQNYFGPYFKNHTKAFEYLNATRDRTPACMG
jgi:hypothetical protein